MMTGRELLKVLLSIDDKDLDKEFILTEDDNGVHYDLSQSMGVGSLSYNKKSAEYEIYDDTSRGDTLFMVVE